MPLGNALAVIRRFRPFPPVITSDGLITWTVNLPNFNYVITATNDPISFGARPLPAGLAINTITGAITGTPTTINVAGTNVSLSAKNSNGTGTKNLLIKILPTPPVITSALTLRGTTGVSLTYNIIATNMATAYSPLYDALDLPPGLTINRTTGVISGTPNTVGVTDTTISARNVAGSDSKILVITIVRPVPVITQPPNFTQAIDTSFSYRIIATNSPTLYTATGLPDDLSVDPDTGLISGTLPYSFENTTYTVTVNASNDTGFGTAKSFRITVIAPPVITSAEFFGGDVQKFITSPAVRAINPPITWSLVDRPSFFSNATIGTNGVINGFLNTTTNQTGSLTIRATNIAGTAEATVMVFATVPPPPAEPVTRILNTNTTESFMRNFNYSQQLRTNGTFTRLTWTMDSPSGWPPGFTLSSDGVINGTFTMDGSWTIRVSVRNTGTGGGTATWVRAVGSNINTRRNGIVD